jgi:hypothetical protein
VQRTLRSPANAGRSTPEAQRKGPNASIRFKLIKGHEYVLRIRLYYRNRSGETAVMMW